MSPTSPLAGVRVVVTRAAAQADPLVLAFRRAGARVERLPLLEVVPPADPRPLARAASELALYDWLVFTSANAVAAFLPQAGGALTAGRPCVAAIGDSTTSALRAAGVEPALVPDGASAEGLVAALAPRVARRRVLLPQAADARHELRQGLTAAGAEVEVVVAYAKRVPPAAAPRAAALFAAGPLGWVTFTSPSIARHFAELFADQWEARRVELFAASIGPTTSAALRALGVEPAAEAEAASDQGLVDAVVGAVWK